MNSEANDAASDQQPQTPAPRRGLRSWLARAAAGALWACLAVAAAWSLAAWLYPQDLRETNHFLQLLNCLAFAGQVLRFHLALACGATAALALLILRWKLAAASIVVGVLLALPTLLAYLPKSPPPAAGPALRVQSINLLGYNYHADEIVAALDAADADVIAVQEYGDWHDAYVAPRLAGEYPYSVRLPIPGTNGMAIFSKRPILEHTPDNTHERRVPDGARSQRAVVDLNGRAVAVWNVHPDSPGGVRSLLSGQRQVADLVDALRQDPLPHVVAGDFNAATGTANLQALLDAGLAEAQAAAGVGPGWTWPRQKRGRVVKYLARLPGLRIDHCFFSPELTATDAGVGAYHGSDHLGIVAELGWRGGP